MFTSVSKAQPGQQVTLSYTATENHTFSCQFPYTIDGVSHTGTSAVALGQNVSTVMFAPIELMTAAFRDYQINGLPCSVGVATWAGDEKLVHPDFMGKYWFDYELSDHTISMLRADGTLLPIDINRTTNASPSGDMVAILDPSSNRLLRIGTDGALKSNITFSKMPTSACNVLDEANKFFNLFVLCQDTVYKVDKANSTTVATTLTGTMRGIAATPTGSCFWLVGPQTIKYGSSLSTLTNITSQYDLVSVVATDLYAYAISRTGEVIRISQSGSVTLLYSGEFVGGIVALNGYVYFTLPKHRMLCVIDTTHNDTIVEKPLEVGFLPYMISADRTKINITGLDSTSVVTYDPTTNAFSTTTYPSEVTFVQSVNDVMFVSDYMQSVVTTIDPTSIVVPSYPATYSGPTLAGSSLRIGAKISVPVSVGLSGAVVKVNGATAKASTYAKQADLVSVQYSTKDVSSGVQSIAVQIGDCVRDWVFHTESQPATTPYVDFGIANVGSYQHEIIMANPDPIWPMINDGEIQVNGVPYDWSTPVVAGDVVKFTSTVVSNQDWKMITLGEAQYVLGPKPRVDTQTFYDVIAYGQIAVSQRITEAGLYTFPPYNGVTWKRNGSVINGTVTLNNNDTITYQTVKSPLVMDTRRDTVFLGPSSQYVVTEYSEWDVVPDFMTFSAIFEPYPSFVYDTQPIVVAGIGEGQISSLYGDYGIEFVVNGGEPSTTASVVNGDTIQLKYTAQNLFARSASIYVNTRSFGAVPVGRIPIYPITLNGSVKEIRNTEMSASRVAVENTVVPFNDKVVNVGLTAITSPYAMSTPNGSTPSVGSNVFGLLTKAAIPVARKINTLGLGNIIGADVVTPGVAAEAPTALGIKLDWNVQHVVKMATAIQDQIAVGHVVAQRMRATHTRQNTVSSPVMIALFGNLADVHYGQITAERITTGSNPTVTPTYVRTGLTSYTTQSYATYVSHAVERFVERAPTVVVTPRSNESPRLETVQFWQAPVTTERLGTIKYDFAFNVSEPYSAIVNNAFGHHEKTTPTPMILQRTGAHVVNGHAGTVVHLAAHVTPGQSATIDGSHTRVISANLAPMLVQSPIYNQPPNSGTLYGAFKTPQDAAADAVLRSYSNYSVISRGEWSSYHVRFGMDITCEVRDRGLYAISGLIGGG